MTSLYLCYQSITEPLTQTQVIAYLEGLTKAGYGMVLLTFEPHTLSRQEAATHRERLAKKGITWYWLPYHKRPTAPATAWDIASGIALGLRLIRRHGVRLLHARGHVPGVMALALKRLTGARFLFDIRGYMAEEYVDAGSWPADGLLFRVTKRAERALVAAADGCVVLTRPALNMLAEWYPVQSQGKPVERIPTCVDLRRIDAPLRREPGLAPERGAPVMVYVGKLGGWYMSEEMCAFAAAAVEVEPTLRWHVYTQSDPVLLRPHVAAYGLDQRTTIGRVAPEDLGRELAKASASLSFIRPSLSKRASSPTKVGEYLAAGLPVVSNSGIGDVDELLTRSDAAGGKPVGALVREFSAGAYRSAAARLRTLMDDPTAPARCRAVAEAELDLERVGWARYRRLYARLAG